MHEYVIAIFNEEPIACEGDDVNAEHIMVRASSESSALTVAQTRFPTKYLLVWSCT